MKEIRLLPLLIVAISALFILKGFGLVVGERHLVGGSGPALAQDGEAAEPATDDSDPNATDEAGTGGDEQAEAGADTEASEEAGDAEAMNAADADAADGDADTATNADKDPAQAKADEPSLLQRVLGSDSRSREALLESLSERREQLEAREKELDLRENLLKATEQRIEARIGELKALEDRITVAKNEKSEEEDERLKNVVTMYENMKPKDAARIFNDLDLNVVVEVASKMSARQMSLILAEMDSTAAQILTLELSSRSEDAVAETAANTSELPQIVGTQPAN